MKISMLFLLSLTYVYFASGKRIKPPIPEELKEACKNAGTRKEKKECLNYQLVGYCQKESNFDTITCKLVRLKTLIPTPISDECTLISSDDFEDEEDCIEEKLEGFCQDIDNHETTACKCAKSRSNRKERRNCLRQQMEAFCDVAEHSGTKVCVKFICSNSADKKAKRECKKQKLGEFCAENNKTETIQCKRLQCQDIEDRKERKKCIKAQMVDYCNDEANADSFTCKKMGIKEVKMVCVQNAIEEFCQEEDNTDTRICKRLRDNDED